MSMNYLEVKKTRLCLAKLLLEEPKLLVLDEPTNHLDSQAISFLENYLKGYKNCFDCGQP